MTGKSSDLGGYLDILADFLVYSLLPLGIFWSIQGDSSSWLALGALLSSFYINAASWMYLSALLAKNEALTSLPMPKGLVEGFESIILLSLMLIFPSTAAILAWTMTCLVILTIGLRFFWARSILDSLKKGE
jgi:phosphatidylserine synthase